VPSKRETFQPPRKDFDICSQNNYYKLSQRAFTALKSDAKSYKTTVSAEIQEDGESHVI